LIRFGRGGIQTDDLCEKTNDILDLLNSNYELVWAWRGKVFTLLSTPLVSMDEREKDAEGNEYALGKLLSHARGSCSNSSADLLANEPLSSPALEQQIEVEAFLEAYVNGASHSSHASYLPADASTPFAFLQLSPIDERF
jgi:hypothetical protein